MAAHKFDTARPCQLPYRAQHRNYRSRRDFRFLYTAKKGLSMTVRNRAWILILKYRYILNRLWQTFAQGGKLNE